MARYPGINHRSDGSVPDRFINNDNDGLRNLSGNFLAKVVDIKDENYLGAIYVELINQQTLNLNDRKIFHKVRPLSPFGGAIQGSDHTTSYGMFNQPPAPGSEVLVAFTGTEQEGYLIGVLKDSFRAGSGLATSELSGGNSSLGSSTDVPVGEPQSGNKRPKHPLADAISGQGLGLDAVRGLSSSGSRRESPSNVFMVSTPSGHSLTLDDGTVNDKNNITPNESREEGKSNLIRMRTSGGAQILFNDSDGMVYLINQTGSNWVQMSEDGKIDIYSEDQISVHCEDNFNLHVGGELNIDADSINMRARGSAGIKIDASIGEFNAYSNRDMKISSSLNCHIATGGSFIQSTGGTIEMNGPQAAHAIRPSVNNITNNTTIKQSLADRVPEREPWDGHTETETIVPSQAQSKFQGSGKDYNVENFKDSKGAPSTKIQEDNETGLGKR